MSLPHRCFSIILKIQLLALSVSETLVEDELKVPSLVYVNSLLVIKNYISILLLTIVRKGVPAILFFSDTHHFLKSLLPLSSFLFYPVLRYFRQPLSTFTQLPNALNPTNQPFLVQTNIEKVYFTSSTVTFYQHSIFNLLNPFTNRLS